MSALSVIETPEIADLLSVAEGSDVVRVGTYINSDIESYKPGSRVQLTFPSNSVVDLRDSFLIFDLSMQNEVAETTETITISTYLAADLSTPVAADGGSYYIKLLTPYGSLSSGPFLFSATPATITTQLATDWEKYLSGIVDTITCTTAFDTGSDLVIVFSEMKLVPSENQYYLAIEESSLVNGTAKLFTNMVITTPGVLQLPYLEYNAVSLFNRVTVEMNSIQILETTQFNLIEILLANELPETYLDTTGILIAGMKTDANNIHPLGTPKRYALKFRSSEIFSHIFPLNLLPGLIFRINLYLEADTNCLVKTPSTSQSYLINNIQYHYHNLEFPKITNDMLLSKINGDGLIYSVKSYSNFVDSIVNSSKDSIMSFSFSNFLGIKAVMRQESYITNSLNKDKLSNFIKSNIQSYRLKVGYKYYPLSDVTLSTSDVTDVAQPYMYYLRTSGIGEDIAYSNNSSIAGLNFTANSTSDYKNYYEKIIRPSFSIDIPTYEPSTHSEKHVATKGVDVSGAINVSLELRGISGSFPISLSVFGKYNSFVILSNKGIIWKK